MLSTYIAFWVKVSSINTALSIRVFTTRGRMDVKKEGMSLSVIIIIFDIMTKYKKQVVCTMQNIVGSEH